jgi:hypothetical protein
MGKRIVAEHRTKQLAFREMCARMWYDGIIKGAKLLDQSDMSDFGYYNEKNR